MVFVFAVSDSTSQSSIRTQSSQSTTAFASTKTAGKIAVSVTAIIVLFYNILHVERHVLQFFLGVYTACTFLARDSIYATARYMPSPVRLSVCHTGGSVKDGSC